MSDRAAQIASLSPEQLKQLIGRLKRSAPQALPRAPRDGSPLPLSFAQERLWFLDRLGLAGSAYNMPATARLTGRLDVATLASALGAVVERREHRLVDAEIGKQHQQDDEGNCYPGFRLSEHRPIPSTKRRRRCSPPCCRAVRR